MADSSQQQRDRIYPRLTDAQIERVASVGTQRKFKAGEVVFDVGDRNMSFFVVLEGKLDILRNVPNAVTGEELIVTHERGEFTGEINMLSGRRAFARARLQTDGELIVVEREQLRLLIQRDAELSEILMRAFILRRVALLARTGATLVLFGSQHSADTMKLREFLTRNAQPFTYEDVDDDPAVQALLDRFQVSVDDIPIVVGDGGKILKNPSTDALARELGLNLDLDAKVVRDLVIVGAGPAGLAAAVYGASEGLDVLVLETTAPGGQAGTSSRIENYLGFPTGISGENLAGRAYSQAEKFGADLAIGRRAVRLDCDSKPYKIILDDGEVVRTRALVIATGVKYRRPNLVELPRFESTGVFYSATHLEAQLCVGEHIAIVGGGNSAGQAAVFLSQRATSVRVVVRGEGLADSMSRYLIQRIANTANVTVHAHTIIESLEGASWLERVRVLHTDSGTRETWPIRHVFMMTGADPHTKWLEGCVQLDDKGFIKTGADLRAEDLAAGHWPLTRAPFLLETTIPGVFAVGDARSGSAKRVAAAVGEGAICVQLAHRALLEL